jgi:hypothetical protein
MSKQTEPLYTVGLHHLSSDAKKADANLGDVQLNYLSAKQIGSLLESAAALAPDVTPPAEPELRITGGTGKFVVKVKADGLHFVSWSKANKGGGNLAPAQIVAIIRGEDGSGGGGGGRQSAGGESRAFGQSKSIGLMAVAILAVNSFTLWWVTRPPRTLLPKYTVMQSGPAERLLTDVAGVYETGGEPGDRRLEIQKDGAAQRIKFGPMRAVAQQQTFTVKPAEAAGKPALVTSRQSIITIKDPVSVVLYGDTYQRVGDKKK